MILGYTAIVSPPVFGWHAEAFVDLYCDGKMPAEAIKRAVVDEPRVVAAHTVAGEASALLHVMARGHQGPGAGAGAHPEHRGRHPDGDRGRPVDPVSAMRRPYPDGAAALGQGLHGLRGARSGRPAQPRPGGAGGLVSRSRCSTSPTRGRVPATGTTSPSRRTPRRWTTSWSWPA